MLARYLTITICENMSFWSLAAAIAKGQNGRHCQIIKKVEKSAKSKKKFSLHQIYFADVSWHFLHFSPKNVCYLRASDVSVYCVYAILIETTRRVSNNVRFMRISASLVTSWAPCFVQQPPFTSDIGETFLLIPREQPAKMTMELLMTEMENAYGTLVWKKVY